MIEKEFMIQNALGLHARPASQFVKLAASFQCNLQVRMEDKTASAKSILSILGMGISKGKVITLIAEGEDESAAMEQIASFLENLSE